MLLAAAPGSAPPVAATTAPVRFFSPALAEGCVLLFLVAGIWVGAGELAQYIFQDLGLREPNFLTYINVSEFMLLLPLAAVRERLGEGGAWAGACGGRLSRFASGPSEWRAAARAGALVCPLWFLAQGSYNAALVFTSVGASTALSATSSLFTLALAVGAWARQRGAGGSGGAAASAAAAPLLLPSRLTTAGVACTVMGALLVGWGDEGGGGSSVSGAAPVGDALSVFSAAMYACYSVAVKSLVPIGGGGGVSMVVFFGFLGLWTSLCTWPLVAGLHFGGVEDLGKLLHLPHAPRLLLLIAFKGLVDNVLSDLLWARAIQLTSPTFASTGLALTIPLSLLADAALRGVVPGAAEAAGAALIFAGFVASGLGE
jgi:solute carrier family 35 protein F5